VEQGRGEGCCRLLHAPAGGRFDLAGLLLDVEGLAQGAELLEQ
jgi:hypothetical protein